MKCLVLLTQGPYALALVVVFVLFVLRALTSAYKRKHPQVTIDEPAIVKVGETLLLLFALGTVAVGVVACFVKQM